MDAIVMGTVEDNRSTLTKGGKERFRTFALVSQVQFADSCLPTRLLEIESCLDQNLLFCFGCTAFLQLL